MLCALQERLVKAAGLADLSVFDLEVDEGDPDFLRHIERDLCWLLLRPGSLRCKPNGEGEDGSRSIQLTQSAFKLGVHNPCITILLE